MIVKHKYDRLVSHCGLVVVAMLLSGIVTKWNINYFGTDSHQIKITILGMLLVYYIAVCEIIGPLLSKIITRSISKGVECKVVKVLHHTSTCVQYIVKRPDGVEAYTDLYRRTAKSDSVKIFAHKLGGTYFYDIRKL